MLVANLPYNVATPLVADLLDGVPAIEPHAGDGAAEVGERLAAGRGRRRLRRGVGEGRLLGHGQGRRAGAGHRVRAPSPRSSRRWWRSSAATGGRYRRRPTDAVPAGAGRASASAARCCAARWPAWSTPPSRRRACGPRPGPRSSTSRRGAGWRRARRPRQADAVAARHRRARRRLPPDRRRDGHPRPGRRRSTFAEGDGLRSSDRSPGLPSRRRRQPRARALAAVGRRAHVRLDKRIPVGAGLGGGSADAAAVLRWAGCDDLAVAASLGADVPFCLVGGRARVTGIGEVVEPLPVRRRRLHPAHAAVRRVDAGRLPGLGRARRPRRPTAPTTSSRPPWPSSPAWPSGATGWATPPGRRRCWPAAARPGSSRGDFPLAGARVVASTDRPPPGGRSECGRRGGYLPGAALPAGGLQHLLVLLLAHALAALLDQRSHGGRGLAVVEPKTTGTSVSGGLGRGSSNGRTPVLVPRMGFDPPSPEHRSWWRVELAGTNS